MDCVGGLLQTGDVGSAGLAVPVESGSYDQHEADRRGQGEEHGDQDFVQGQPVACY